MVTNGRRKCEHGVKRVSKSKWEMTKVEVRGHELVMVTQGNCLGNYIDYSEKEA